MKLKVIVHPDFHAAFDRLKKSLVPATTAYKIRKLWGQFKEEHLTFENVRKDIMNRYADKDENGVVLKGEKGDLKFSRENMELANQEIMALLDTEFEPVFHLSIDDLGKAELSAEDFAFLEPMFKD